MKMLSSVKSALFNNYNVFWLAIYCGISFGVAYLYLNNIILAAWFSSVGFLMERFTAPDRELKRKRDEILQFRSFVDIVNGSMTATNKAVEVCIDDAIDCIGRTHMDRSRVYKELLVMQKNLHGNYQSSVEEEFKALAERLDNKDIAHFASSVSACYGIDNQGISKVIRNFSCLVQEKIQIEDEIASAIAGEKNQVMLMLFAPSIILIVLKVNMGDFISCAYGSVKAMAAITCCLILNYLMFFLIQKIVRKGM